MINVYDPEVIALGGGASVAGSFLLDAVRRKLPELALQNHALRAVELADAGQRRGVDRRGHAGHARRALKRPAAFHTRQCPGTNPPGRKKGKTVNHMVNFNDIKENPTVHTYYGGKRRAGRDRLYGARSVPRDGRSLAAPPVLKATAGYGGGSWRIAGCIHDMGNMINREYHALTGATVAFQILSGMGMPPDEIATVCPPSATTTRAAAWHNRVAAALILATNPTCGARVRTPATDGFREDIHDRVNYAVTKSWLELRRPGRDLPEDHHRHLNLPRIEYFKIFLTCACSCKGASEFLGARFSLTINNTVLM